MKTFKDLEFKPHPNFGHDNGVQAIIKFENGFGASVVCTPFTYGGKEGLYELAVLKDDGSLTYDTPITNDVLGYLSKKDVTEVLVKIQQL
jgi:predicted dehydrogenase